MARRADVFDWRRFWNAEPWFAALRDEERRAHAQIRARAAIVSRGFGEVLLVGVLS